jgi:hypothetical protein
MKYCSLEFCNKTQIPISERTFVQTTLFQAVFLLSGR